MFYYFTRARVVRLKKRKGILKIRAENMVLSRSNFSPFILFFTHSAVLPLFFFVEIHYHLF